MKMKQMGTCFATQIVPPQDPQAILRFKESDSTTQVAQREFHLQLPIDLNTEVSINLGRLKQNENPNAAYQQFVRLSDPNRPADKQIISREHASQDSHLCNLLFLNRDKRYEKIMIVAVR